MNERMKRLFGRCVKGIVDEWSKGVGGKFVCIAGAGICLLAFLVLICEGPVELPENAHLLSWKHVSDIGKRIEMPCYAVPSRSGFSDVTESQFIKGGYGVVYQYNASDDRSGGYSDSFELTRYEFMVSPLSRILLGASGFGTCSGKSKAARQAELLRKYFEVNYCVSFNEEEGEVGRWLADAKREDGVGRITVWMKESKNGYKYGYSIIVNGCKAACEEVDIVKRYVKDRGPMWKGTASGADTLIVKDGKVRGLGGVEIGEPIKISGTERIDNDGCIVMEFQPEKENCIPYFDVYIAELTPISHRVRALYAGTRDPSVAKKFTWKTLCEFAQEWCGKAGGRPDSYWHDCNPDKSDTEFLLFDSHKVLMNFSLGCHNSLKKHGLLVGVELWDLGDMHKVWYDEHIKVLNAQYQN